MNIRRIAALLLSLLLLVGSASAAELGFTVRAGDRSIKRICSTVDDCYDVAVLEKILNLSKELEVPITFFVVGGAMMEADREIWRAVAESSCEIGSHTMWHDSLPSLTHSAIVRDLKKVEERVDQVLGYHYPVQVIRPPYGRTRIGGESNMPVVRALREAGYNHAVLWDVSQTDPVQCMRDVKNGSILLFHTLEKDYECLKTILPQLKEKGYDFVTVSEMLGMEPPVIVYPEATDMPEATQAPETSE